MQLTKKKSKYRQHENYYYYIYYTVVYCISVDPPNDYLFFCGLEYTYNLCNKLMIWIN